MNPKRKILVVEDEPEIRQGVSRWLNAAGFETLFAEDGEIGLASARNHGPDAILMDVLMPNKGGLATLRELRIDDETAKIPVVMLSASLRDEQQALDAGAKYFVHKPYDGKKLVATMKAVVDSTPVR